VPRRQHDLVADLLEPVLGRLARQAGELREGARQDRAHGLRAVQRRVGVLEDDLDRAPGVGGALRGQPGERLPVEADHATLVGGVDAEDRLRERRLAGARLAHEPERLAGPQLEVDADQGAHLVPALPEGLRDVLELEHHVARRDLADGRRDRSRHELADAVEVMAEHGAVGTRVRGGRQHRPALRGGQGAAVLEDAGGQRRADQGQGARDRVEAALALGGAAARQAAQEADGVRVLRVVEHLAGDALLHDAARVHDADAVAGAAHDAEVVGDQEDRRPRLVAEGGDEVEHLGLHRRVEARGGLVEDQELRVAGQRHRDHGALLHAAGELVGIALHHALGVGDAHAAQRLDGALAGLVLRGAEDGERLRDLPAHLDRGVERLPRVLVDHRDAAGAQLAQRLVAHRRDVVAADQRAPARDVAVARQVADRGEGRRRLAAARLADEAVGLARLDLERDAAQDGPQHAADVVGDLEVLDLERGRALLGGAHRSLTSCRASATRLTAITRLAMASAGNTVTHQ